MDTGLALLEAIKHQPDDDTVRLIYADWLEENGRPNEAKTWRRRPVREIDLESIAEDYAWKEVFGEGSGGNTSKGNIDACPPGSTVDLTAPTIADVVEVIAAVNGERDEQHWTGVFRLRDGRILLADGWCDYTGWD